MGQEQSAIIDPNTPPRTLSARTLPAVAELIKDGQARRIIVMTGAGLSTAAGIPDFRSPKTGLYANLERFNLPRGESIFDMEYFRENPEPFYVLAKDLYPGNYSPTISHVFITLLAQKGLLRMLFTQNIDCLERQAGVPPELIIEAHGSFATQRCIECKTPIPDDEMKEHVHRGEVPRCRNAECNGLVKPDIVFFGEQLPDAFHHARRDVPETADLVIIMGTSLSVQPFAQLPELVPEGTPRVLFNRERVGSLGSRADDVILLDDCDTGVRRLADQLGWLDELENDWRRIVGHEEAEKQLRSGRERDLEVLNGLTDRIETSLTIRDDGAVADSTDSESDLLTPAESSLSRDHLVPGTKNAEEKKSAEELAAKLEDRPQFQDLQPSFEETHGSHQLAFRPKVQDHIFSKVKNDQESAEEQKEAITRSKSK